MTKAEAVRLVRACKKEGLETAIASWSKGRWRVYVSDTLTGYDAHFDNFRDALARYDEWRQEQGINGIRVR